MGCNPSKLENEEAVSRCKERKCFMNNAVTARNAFAAAHSSYAVSLRTTGGALNDFSQELVQDPHSAVAAAATSSSSSVPFPTQPLVDTLPPPPPPPSDGSNSLEMHSPPPLHRAISMPEYVASKSKSQPSEAIIEEEDEEEDFEDQTNLKGRRSSHRRAGGGGSVRGRMMRDEEGPPPPPSPPPETPPSNRAVPPPPETSASAWDYYIFGNGMEGMTGGSFRDAEDLRKENEERERMEMKVMEEAAERSETGHATNAASYNNVVHDSGGEGIHRNRKVDEMLEAPQTVPEKPPLPPQHPGGGKMLKRGKQVLGEAPAGGGSVGKRAGMSLNLLQIFTHLDDCFLKASESAHDVSKMLEATKLHYHSNFADNRGHIDHSARVMRVITWNRSFRGLPNADYEKEEFDSEEHETHATVLDKLLAWEKKLYDEVKAGELMKFEYQRKVAVLNKLKKRGTNSEALEKAKAAVSHLHTRYIVDMQSLDSTVAEINSLRDEQLYPKLAELVNAMAMMWESMQVHHENQLKMAAALKIVDMTQSTNETSGSLYDCTDQLLNAVENWHLQFEKMVSKQKEYIKALNSWLKLNLIPIESSLKEKVSSPPRAQHPPIQRLLLAWEDFLEKLPDEHAKGAIFSFAAVIQTILQQQEEEMKLKQQCDASRKDLVTKSRKFDDWYHKYMEQKTAEETDQDRPETSGQQDMVAEKQSIVEAAKKKLEEDEEKYHRQCIHVRDKTLASLRARMPELFQAMSEFAYACADMYRNLKAISHSQKHKQRESSS